MKKSLRVHWSLSQAGDTFRKSKSLNTQSGVANIEAQVALCQQAEAYGIDSMLMAIGFTRPDPLLLSLMLGQATQKLKFMVAVRPGLISPTLFVQQINTLSCLINGRVHINVVSGRSPQEHRYYGDFFSHDKRYQRTAEFMAICNAFWQQEGEVNFKGEFYEIENGKLNTPFVSPNANKPEIFIGGNSDSAAKIAGNHADCLWRFPDTPERLQHQIQTVLEQGKEVGLLVSLITRPTQEEALASAQSLLERFVDKTREVVREFHKQSDSEGFQSVYALSENNLSHWVTSYLWTGAVPYLGAPAIALVGSYENVAKAIIDYDAIGISQYLFMGWPDIEEMTHWAKGVLPLLNLAGISCGSAI